MAFANGLQQQLLPLGVQFGQDIVEQQQGRHPTEAGDQLQFGQLEREHKAALLACGAEPTCRLPPEQQGHVIPLWPNAAIPQTGLLRPLFLQLIQQALLPHMLVFVAVELGAGLVEQLQLFASATEPFLPRGSQGFQPFEGAVAATMQASSDHCQLVVKGIQQLIAVAELAFEQL